MMATEREERWLDVLAGRKEPDDEETRQAASARAFFLRQASEDMKGGVDAERLQRLQAYVQAREAAPKPAAIPATPANNAKRENPLLAALHWLFPPGQANGLRYAMTAALVLGVVVAPILTSQGPHEEDPGMIKQFPGGKLNLPETDRLQSPDPNALAQRLSAVLAADGASASISSDGNDRVLSAQLSPEQIASLRPKLAADGLHVPDNGRLRIRIEKAN